MVTLTLEGKQYDIDTLTDEAKQQVANVQAVDSRIQQANSELAVYQTARNAYGEALASQLPKPAHPNKKKDVVTVDDKKYALAEMSDEAKAQLQSLQFVDRKLSEIQALKAALDA